MDSFVWRILYDYFFVYQRSYLYTSHFDLSDISGVYPKLTYVYFEFYSGGVLEDDISYNLYNLLKLPSTVVDGDKVYFDDRGYAISDIVTEYMEITSNGSSITRRINLNKKIDIGCDYRNVRYRRYDIGGEWIGLHENYYIPTKGTASNVYEDFPLFGEFDIVNHLKIDSLDNSIFLLYASENTIGGGFKNNTILGHFNNNIINNRFNNNVIYDNFHINKINSYFFYNVIGKNFTENIIEGDSLLIPLVKISI